MKIPKELLKAPMNELMSGDLKKTFQRIGYGGIPTWTNTGCAFFCYMDKKTCRQVKGAVHDVKLELHKIDGCPIIRFDIKVYDQIIDPLHFDAFLNIANRDHDSCIEALVEQEWLIFHWYGPGFKYTGSTGIRWPEAQRTTATNIIDRAKAVVSDTAGGDFDRAKAKWMAENPLD